MSYKEGFLSLMAWNWQLSDWPKFCYDPAQISALERQFLLSAGRAFAFLRNIGKEDQNQFIVEILSQEGLQSSKIEGEILDKESLQSSIKRHFGLDMDSKQNSKKESGMAKLLCHVYETFDQPLTHEMLREWHSLFFGNQHEFAGKYRTHEEPMQIVSARYDSPRVFFEAPPSKKVPHEMARFIDWFNSDDNPETILGKAAIAHVYFESIHPFEDGNGRIGRALVEKILSQGTEQPLLIAVSRVLEKRKKDYYEALGRCNKTLEADHFVRFFADVILQAQEASMSLLYFLIEKSKMLNRLSGQINQRQEKTLLRMFSEGPNGFNGGLSAENYIAITKTSRATATRDLLDLVQKGALLKTGELKHTRYWLNITPNGH